MDEKEQDGDTHARAHTMRVPFEVIDISVEKWAPSKLHMSRMTESGRAWWSAVWSLILALTQCWAAVSSGRKQRLKTCRRSSTFSVRHDWSHFLACGGTQHTALLTKHFHDISINTAIDHTHTKKKKKQGGFIRAGVILGKLVRQGGASPIQVQGRCWGFTFWC